MKDLKHVYVPFELRKASEDGSEFDGHGSTFYKIDDYGSIFDVTAFDETIEFFLSSGFIGGLNHDWLEPIGKPLEARVDKIGLWLKARISDTARGRDVRTLIKDGVIRGLSIGFRTSAYEWLDTEEDVQSYWKKHGYTPDAEDLVRCRYGALLKTKVQVYEVSPVTVPSNSAATITDVRSSAIADHLSAIITRVKDGEVTPEIRSQLMSLRGNCDELLGRFTDVVTPDETEMRTAHELDLLQFEADFLALGGRL